LEEEERAANWLEETQKGYVRALKGEKKAANWLREGQEAIYESLY
jgi:hypothetical protein